MSEYIEIEAEPTGDPDVMHLVTNVDLMGTGQPAEQYHSVAEMEEGSPLAQMLAYVEGIRELQIAEQTITIRRDATAEWHVIVADISAAVKDFFL